MKCRACDEILTDYEATRKSKVTNEYIDLCNSCFSTIEDTFIETEEQLEQEESIGEC